MIKEITPQDFLKRRADGHDMTLLDVREDWEVRTAPVPAAVVHIPMGQIADRLGELDPPRRRWSYAAPADAACKWRDFLSAQKFATVQNLCGGILAWSRDVDPTIPQY